MSFSFVCSPVTDWGHVQDVPHLLPEDSYNRLQHIKWMDG